MQNHHLKGGIKLALASDTSTLQETAPSSRRNKLLRWDFKVHIRSRSSSTPIGPLSLYRLLRESHRPQGVDIDHFGYP
ncbi:hypothetical protein T03_12205 [Trichinella britovi]|uniref:Uncharacterized protein n=1 Tax=Trichinella britovi TaxID=45882 RepID=A0A0V1CZC7_TRIBR|nr:hypothetical protein T03_12205 [Trichinella britovi]